MTCFRNNSYKEIIELNIFISDDRLHYRLLQNNLALKLLALRSDAFCNETWQSNCTIKHSWKSLTSLIRWWEFVKQIRSKETPRENFDGKDPMTFKPLCFIARNRCPSLRINRSSIIKDAIKMQNFAVLIPGSSNPILCSDQNRLRCHYKVSHLIYTVLSSRRDIRLSSEQYYLYFILIFFYLLYTIKTYRNGFYFKLYLLFLGLKRCILSWNMELNILMGYIIASDVTNIPLTFCDGIAQKIWDKIDIFSLSNVSKHIDLPKNTF